MILWQTDSTTPPCVIPPSLLMNICISQLLFSISNIFIICIAISKKSAIKELQLPSMRQEKDRQYTFCRLETVCKNKRQQIERKDKKERTCTIKKMTGMKGCSIKSNYFSTPLWTSELKSTRHIPSSNTLHLFYIFSTLQNSLYFHWVERFLKWDLQSSMYKNLFVFQICAFNTEDLPLELSFMMSLFLCRSLNIITNSFRHLCPTLVTLLQNLTTFNTDKCILYCSNFNLTLIYNLNIK